MSASLEMKGLKAGWRRAKSLDNFRHRAPHVQEALFLDDPSRSKVSIADLKSFLTADEDGIVESRYNVNGNNGWVLSKGASQRHSYFIV